MKNKRYVTFLIIAVFFSSLSFGVTSSLNKTRAVQSIGDSETTLQPNLIGEIDFLFETPVGMYEIEHLNGLIYGVDGTTTKIYVYNAVTGENTVNYTVPTASYGIATDGTNLYTTVYTPTTPNGTIIKLDLSGNEISRINIPIAGGLLNGLAWDGSQLWAFQNSPGNLIRIDYDSGVVTRNISVTNVPHGMTWFNDNLWVENYSFDQTAVYNPLTGAVLYTFSAPYHFDSGLSNNGTHLIQSRYIDAMDPYAISFTKIATEPGDIFTKSISYLSNMLDITYDGTSFYFAENSSNWIYTINAVTTTVSTVWSTPINPVGLTMMGDIIVASEENAPYNLYTFTKAGAMLSNHTALGIMIRSLAFDGTYLWAMGADNVLYKLNPADMSIVSNYAIGYFKGITYDHVNDVIWVVSSSEHKIKYFDIEKEQLGNNMVNLTAPVSPAEYGLTFDGDYLAITTSAGGGYFYRIIPCEIDEEIITTPTPTTPFEGLFGLSNLFENLLFAGFGLVGAGLIFGLIVLLRKIKK